MQNQESVKTGISLKEAIELCNDLRSKNVGNADIYQELSRYAPILGAKGNPLSETSVWMIVSGKYQYLQRKREANKHLPRAPKPKKVYMPPPGCTMSKEEGLALGRRLMAQGLTISGAAKKILSRGGVTSTKGTGVLNATSTQALLRYGTTSGTSVQKVIQEQKYKQLLRHEPSQSSTINDIKHILRLSTTPDLKIQMISALIA